MLINSQDYHKGVNAAPGDNTLSKDFVARQALVKWILPYLDQSSEDAWLILVLVWWSHHHSYLPSNTGPLF